MNLDTGIYIRLRNMAETEGSTVSELVNRLLAEAFEKGPGGAPFASHGAADDDLEDLGAAGEEYIMGDVRKRSSNETDRKLAAIRAAVQNRFPSGDIETMLTEIESGNVE